MKDQSVTVKVPYEFGDKESMVKAKVTFGYDGIGSYEYWGQKCYDRGNLCCEEIIIEEIDGVAVTDYEASDDLLQKIEDEALEKLNDLANDYPEPPDNFEWEEKPIEEM